MLKKIAEHWGSDTYSDRWAEIFEDSKRGCFVVKYYANKKLIETRDMITDGRAHSMSYAEDAAENYCLGYMAIDGEKSE